MSVNGHDVARILVGSVELGSLAGTWAPIFVVAVVIMGLLAVVVAHFARGGRPDH